MGFFSFISKAWDGLKSLPSKAWDTVKNGADVWSTVNHAAGSVSDAIKSGAKAVVKAAPIVYHKAKDVAKILCNNAKDLMHKPFQVLSNPLTVSPITYPG